MAVIDIGDGRIVDYVEGALRAPPPPAPKPKKPWVPPKKDGRNKSVVINGQKFKCDPRPADRKNRGNPNLTRSKVPGFIEWCARRTAEIMSLTAAGRALGTPQGMTKKKADALWVVAKRKAKKDMANIKKSGIVLSEAAEEALTASLETMRSPMSQQVKLAAAKLVLDFTMAKPAAKSEVSINAAEQWLEQLGKE